ncbi:MAG: hypothetical protein VX246_01920 [Myxococcota bacterium]|nr:hypothetical protein [Myxococcota bacterium]
MSNTRQHTAAALALSLLALGPVLVAPHAAHALSIVEGEDLSATRRLPAQIIELNSCPPRCAASTYAQLNPSKFYQPLEPDEIVFDGQTSLIWGNSAGSGWLIWGRATGPTITVWDSSMWIDEAEPIGVDLPHVAAGQYKVSKELRIKAPRSARTRRRGSTRSTSAVSNALANAQASDLGDAGVAPPDLLTPTEPSWFATVLERLSQSQYAVGAVTLSLVVLMARLVR